MINELKKEMCQNSAVAEIREGYVRWVKIDVVTEERQKNRKVKQVYWKM